MKNVYKVSILLLMCLCASAQDTTTNSYAQTNLVSDIAGMAPVTDTNLVNPWGLSRGSNTPWWVSDEATGVSTLYDGNGTIVLLVVTIPSASGTGHGTPTGTVFSGGNFLFVTLDGTISEWTGTGTIATIKVNNSSKGAVYTGCTLAKNGTVQTLYVANAAGGVEAYDTSFHPVTLAPGAFVDPSVPAGFAPYGIQSVGTTIYVTFTAAPGAGKGFVSAFDPTGKPLASLNLQHGKWMNQPWGIAHAPASFGKFSHAILVGMTGSGQIAAFNPSTGKFLGMLNDSTTGKPITNTGLWAIFFGGGNPSSGLSNTLYFVAGIQNYAHGLFGNITAQ
jgi:uncharacterized protein (TIGR03118 family)